jgi:hypothetical protein
VSRQWPPSGHGSYLQPGIERTTSRGRSTFQGARGPNFQKVSTRSAWSSGATPSTNIDEDLLSVEDRRWYEEAEEADAVEFAEQHGYDLYIEEGTFCLLDDWDLFLAMILAKARGIPHPRECCGAEDQARGGALRREQEARRHQRPLSEISPASLDEKINDSAA